MMLLLVALAVMALSGFATLFFFNRPYQATVVGVGGVVAGCIIGLVPAVCGLLLTVTESFQLPWQVPGGSFHIQMDALSAFLLAMFLLLGRQAGSLDFDAFGVSLALFQRDIKRILAYSSIENIGLIVLALVGGLALLCFVRLIAISLLGEGRSDGARCAHESSVWMTAPICVLSLFCVTAAVIPGMIVSVMSTTVEQVFGIPAASFISILNAQQSPLVTLGITSVVVWIGLGVGALLFLALQKRDSTTSDGTWGCGYLAPTPRMQYTGQSFSEFVVTCVFPRSLRPKTTVVVSQGLFPSGGKMATEYLDPLYSGLYQPFFERWADRFVRLRWLQQGRLHYYLYYFVVALVVALAWVVLRGWVMS